MNSNSFLGRFRRSGETALCHSKPKTARDENANESNSLLSFMTGITCTNPESGRRIWVSAILLSKTAYSAAAKASLVWAEDFMKSEIRGTISDLNREPLKTP